MSKTKQNKKPALLFVGGFIVIIVVMLIANQSKDVEVVLEMPRNEGIRSLSTYDNRLLAVASDGKTFLWDWNSLDQKAINGTSAFGQALLLDADSVVSIKQGRSSAVVVSSVQGEKIEKEIRLSSDTDLGTIISSRDRNALVAVLAVSSDSKDLTDYKFYNIDLERKRSSRITQVSDDNSLIQLTDFAVSDDGGFVTAAGEQDHKARLVLVDITRGRVTWDKTYASPDGFGAVVFSFDGKTIYAGGSDGSVYYIQTSDGRVIDQFKFKKEASAAHDTISIQNIAISPDDSMIAYIYGFEMYVFDHKNKIEIHSQRPSPNLPGPIVFSPDSSSIAASDLRQGKKLNIWPIPEH
ncbi:MAG: hypothetical protein KAJ07_01190 [Planctomycetes bacterium]|nr:hypothetical protein [Planctomycetota bacterium]